MPIHAIGGPKAGANQAMGLFAFLFDRAERGVEKDEVAELIWPDTSLTAADAAFHRTLLGLRGALRSGTFGDPILHRAGRYVLAPGLVSWSDLMEIELLLERSAQSTEPSVQWSALEACRALNRADYMDDCPFFGESAFVEGTRELLRSVRRAVLVQLAELYDDAGHHALAAMRRAEAMPVALESAARPAPASLLLSPHQHRRGGLQPAI